MLRVTRTDDHPAFDRPVEGARIAIVCPDPELRVQAARAFDDAPFEWQVRLFETAPPDADVVVRAPDVPGDGIELDLDHPETTIERVAASLLRRSLGRVIEVAGAGGGVGCTSIAIHLTSFLSRGGPALYVEGETGCGGRLRLGLDEDTPDWADVRDPDALALAALPVVGGFRSLLAPLTGGCVRDEVLVWARSRFPFVIVDRGRACDPVAIRGGDRILVLAPSVPSARRALALLHRSEEAPALVTNRLGPGSEVTDRALEAILGDRRVALTLPCSPSLRDAEDTGGVLSPNATAWSRRIARLAEVLEQ